MEQPPQVDDRLAKMEAELEKLKKANEESERKRLEAEQKLGEVSFDILCNFQKVFGPEYHIL